MFGAALAFQYFLFFPFCATVFSASFCVSEATMIVWPVVMFMAVLAVSLSPSGEVQRIILVLTCGWVIWLGFRVNHTTLILDSSSSSVTTRISQNLSFFSE